MRAIRNLLELLALWQLLAHCQCGHVQEARRQIRAELSDILGPPQGMGMGMGMRGSMHYHTSHSYNGQRVHRLRMPNQRWSGRRRSMGQQHSHPFSRWTQWSPCDTECVMKRERYCKAKRRCGHTKHVEQRKCNRCHPAEKLGWPVPTPHHFQMQSAAPSAPPPPSPSIIINAAAAASSGYHPQSGPRYSRDSVEMMQPSSREDDHSPNYDGDFFILKQRRRINKKKHRQRQRPSIDLYDEDSFENSLDSHERRARPRQRSLNPDSDAVEGDIFQYEDFDFEQDSQYVDSAEYGDYRNGSLLPPNKERNTPDGLTPRHRRIYSKWSRWTRCSSKCTTRRYKKCRVREQCGREVLREIAYCYTEGSFCQQWLQTQIQKTPAYETRVEPVTAMRRIHTEPSAGSEVAAAATSNAIVNSDYILSGKGYRGPEYTPPKLVCGLTPMRSGRRNNMYNMLKIIGGKAARKGEWPWQVAIFNRFKEAFCGGTLIAPQWVLTAAHCVRKVLYVRMGEHNLDYEDGTELQLRVLKSYKHPNFDKRTVDSDVALLRLPKAVNATNWIGYSCLPRPYQPLPKNMDCTVIGWGKRRNRDVSGTSVLHQAEVPIIPMDNCRSVYHDYTISKNMFCAGHRRGRIDTCAGDSGGPLLCRDTTKPNHPWTIFGITSFGDGCAKRNKFGIYAKVPNYVDWVWSVVNCNGNCKLHQLQRGSVV